MIIAIDGPAASGKGTIARRLAARYGLPHLDTGLLYRATAAALIGADRDLYDERAAVAAARGLGLTDFDEQALRSRDMAEAASIVAAMPGVRDALIEAQRAFAVRPGGAVLDGRDIGTVVCPDRRRQNLRDRERRRRAPSAGRSNWRNAANAPTTRRSCPISSSATPAIPGVLRRRCARRRTPSSSTRPP